MFVVDDTIDTSSLSEHTQLRAPFGMLRQLLGPPSDDTPEKCSTLWCLRGEMDRERVMLKDWQDEDDSSFKVDAFRAQPTYDWEVWAPNQQVASKFCRWLSAQVIARLRDVKTLSAEGKAELNRLIREGVPLAEAMKRVPVQSPDAIEQRFAWPITLRLR